MAVDLRMKNANWQVTDSHGQVQSMDAAHLAVLMDLRDELRGVRGELYRLNSLLHCQNFVGIPATLRSIRRAIPVRRKKASA